MIGDFETQERPLVQGVHEQCCSLPKVRVAKFTQALPKPNDLKADEPAKEGHTEGSRRGHKEDIGTDP